ncbi:MAG TPA: hypothetical protein ENO00_08250 [Deltaproteobacteria bacterium]|nr:hypothetical protein [Deltaproteobacteria bacterium]
MTYRSLTSFFIRPGKLCLILSIIMLLFPVIFPLSAQAHPPGTVILQYSPDAETLTVTITHSVSDQTKHFVKSVKITQNGELIKTFEYTSQPDTSTFTYEYVVQAKEKDELRVRVGCSRFGSRTATLIVGGSK